ncbi:hypothetical protein [Streptomyces sp. NPDC050704]|uniref:pyridoxamine 5'-phosphate oxidase family protein n=1 Tax=Streptomyces sp. NPDC050704 TaxID=3157219 RepID=UPI0034466D82
MDRSHLTEPECREVLSRTQAARLAIARRGLPYIEPVGLIHFDGEPVALLGESSPVARALATVVSPRRLVVLQTDDLAGSLREVHSVTAIARPRWVVGLDDVRECRRLAAVRGLDVWADTWFLALTRPTLVGHRVPLRRPRTEQAPAIRERGAGPRSPVADQS